MEGRRREWTVVSEVNTYGAGTVLTPLSHFRDVRKLLTREMNVPRPSHYSAANRTSRANSVRRFNGHLY